MSSYIEPFFTQLRALLQQQEIDNHYISNVRDALEAWIDDIIEWPFDNEQLLNALQKSLAESNIGIIPLDIFAAKFIFLYLERSFDDHDAKTSRHFLGFGGLCCLELEKNYKALEQSLDKIPNQQSTVNLKKYIIQFAKSQQKFFERLEDLLTFQQFHPLYLEHQAFIKDMKRLYVKELENQKQFHKEQDFAQWEVLSKLFEVNIIEIPNIYYQKLLALYPDAQINQATRMLGLFGQTALSMTAAPLNYLYDSGKSALEYLKFK